MGFTLAAASMSKIVLAHDTSDADQESLGEPYNGRSVAMVSTGLRWFYCGGLSVALVFTCMISMSHIHNNPEFSRLSKEWRLLVRFFAGIVILLLPLVPSKTMSSLALIGTTCSIVVGALIIDLYGLSRTCNEFWRGGFSDSGKKEIRYAED